MHLLEDLNVTWRSAPFTGKVQQMALPQGLSCAEIVARVPGIHTQRFLEQGMFCINGEPVPRDMWHHVRPKANRNLCVTMHMPIRGGGGGGGGKDALRIVAAIALVVVSTVVVPYLTPIIGPLGAQLVGAGITIGGALLLGAFVKPPAAVPETPESGGEDRSASLSGNILRRGEPIPRVVGTHRVYPPFIVQPLTDLDGYDEVVEAVYGLSGPHRIRDLRFGDVLADDIDPEQLEYQVYELIPGEGGLDENVELYLPLNGSQDSVAFLDFGNNSVSITATGAVFIDKVDGWIQLAAAYFGGSGSFIGTPSIGSFFIDDGPFSIDFWFEWDTAGTVAGHPCGHADSGLTAAGSAFYVTKNTSGQIEFRVSNGTTFTTLTSSTTINEGRHHFAGWRFEGVLYLAIDGIIQDSTPFTDSVPACSGTFCIGSSGSDSLSNTWQGWINQFRYTVAKSWYEDQNIELPQLPYRPAEPDLVTRYGKTGTPNIKMARHQILDDAATQGTRDKLANQSTPQRSLPQPQSVVIRGTGFDEAWVTLTFQGLFYTDDAFEQDWFNGLPIRVRVRKLGPENPWFNLPEFHVHERRSAPFSRMLVFRWDSDTRLPSGVPITTPLARKAWKAAYYSVPTQTITPVGIGGWTADSHFYAGSGDTYLTDTNLGSTGLRNIDIMEDRIEVFLDGLVDQGPIEVELTRGQLYTADKFTYSTYNLTTDPPADALSNGVVDFFGYQTLGADQVILLKPSNASDEVIISRIASVWNSPPITRKGEFAAIYITVKARSLDALNVIGSGLVQDWDEATEEWVGLNVTSNPAPHYRDVLVGKLNDNRLPASMVDDEVLLEWRQRCTDLNFQCNTVFKGDSVDRVLDVIASCGYARPRQSELWDVAQDRDFANIPPAQVFNPRNMRGFRWDKAFIRHRPDGLRVKFNDAEDSYLEKTIVVPRLGLALGTASRLEEIRYDGLVTLPEVVFKAVYDQQQVVDRFTFYRGEIDAEILVCRRGDLVLVQHDTLDRFAGFSRILEVEVQEGGLVEALELDGSVSPVDAFFLDSPTFFTTPTDFFTSDVGVAVRQKDGTVLTFPASLSADGFTLTPTPPLTNVDAGIFTRECLVNTGRLLRDSRRMLVFDIHPRADLTAEVTFVDEAPQLWQFPEPLLVEEAFMRNKVINGDMRIDQRGIGEVHTISDQVDTATLDRWFAFNGDSVAAQARFTVQQLTDSPPSGFTHYLEAVITDAITPIPAADRYAIFMPFEGRVFQEIDWGRSTGRQMALQFMVRSSVTGTFSGRIYLLHGLTYIFTYTIPVANTWVRRIVTIPAPPTSPPGFIGNDDVVAGRIEWSLGLGSGFLTASVGEWLPTPSATPRGASGETGVVETLGATWDLTGVQFEIGPATQFEWLPLSFQQELAYRYCQVYRPSQDHEVIGSGVATTTTAARVSIPLVAPLRSVPPVSVTVNAASNFDFLITGPAEVTLTSLVQLSPDQCSKQVLGLDAAVAAGLTAGDAILLRQHLAGVLTVDAELY